MQIVHLIRVLDPTFGGPVEVSVALSEAQAALGHQVTLIATDSPWQSTGRIEPPQIAGVDVEVFPSWPPRALGVSPALAQRVSDLAGPDVVMHVHGVYTGLLPLACAVARARGGAVVAEPHGALTEYHRAEKRWKKEPFERLIDRPSLRRADLIKVSSDRERQQLVPMASSVDAVIVPHGIRIDRPVVDYQSRPNLALFLGRIATKKRLDLTIDVFERCSAAIDDLQLLIVGPGASGDTERLADRARCLGVADRVTFTGPRSGDARWRFYESARLFILLSEDESYGNTVVESLACGTPVLASEHVASAADLADGHSVVVVPLDVEAAADAAQRMLADPAAGRIAGLRATALRTERSWSRIAVQLEVVYADALARARDRQFGRVVSRDGPGRIE